MLTLLNSILIVLSYSCCTDFQLITVLSQAAIFTKTGRRGHFPTTDKDNKKKKHFPN